MYRSFTLLLCLTASNSLYSETSARADNTSQHLQEARTQTQAFGKQLKQVLKSNVQQHGFEQAISACNLQAPAIATSLSENQWQVRRTSLRLRNPDNAADEWEKRNLLKFEQRLAQGEPAHSLEILETDNGTVRYMKAIPTGKLCLGCHGESLADDVKQRLQLLYPTDQATGYTIGQLRGAFSLKRELNQASAVE
tara:strand:+ start:2012 stop:2596 length:585 start_codon:yes stop_codon:yes gene_type:complete